MEADPEAKLLSDGGNYQECLLSILNSARSEILLEFYIFANDDFGNRILEVLARRAKVGVRVRLLVDGFGSRQWLKQELNVLKLLPLEIRVYHPMPWSPANLRHALRLSREFLFCLGTANRRDHRKVVIVDSEVAIMGSHNVWNESLAWHEASLLLGESSAKQIRESFERVWHYSSDLEGRRSRPRIWRSLTKFIHPREEDPHSILDNSTLRRSRMRSRTILKHVSQVQGRLWIMTPYLLPHRILLKHIRKHAEAGVDVRLILPRRTDVPFSRWIAQAHYSELLSSGVRIHEYTGGVLHAKVMIMDDTFVLGSSNMNHRSFFQDLEVDYLGRGVEELRHIVQWAESTLEQCEVIDDIVQVRLFRLKKCLALLVNPIKTFF